MSKELLIGVNLVFLCLNAGAMCASNSLVSAVAFGFGLAIAFVLAIIE